MVSPGLDLELSFSQALQGLGLSAEAARLLWLPLPMLLVLVADIVVIWIALINGAAVLFVAAGAGS